MKKIAIWNNYTNFSNNRVFEPSAYGIGEELGYPIIHLKNELEKLGYTVITFDMDKPENFEKIIFLDVPNPKTCPHKLDLIPQEKKYLVLVECQMIYKANGDPNKHRNYNKVFYYNDDYVQKYGYIKLNMSNKFKIPLEPPEKYTKLCSMIAGNKNSKEVGELYSQRLETLNFFEKNHLDDFDLYGVGWNEHRFYGIKPVRALNRIPFLNSLLARKYNCYKGCVEKKTVILNQYKFSICYENSNAIPGYISEKIWDCFFAGTVPVYWGAPNITDYIPSSCFIDRRNFFDNNELYEYLIGMDDTCYNEYLENIKNFLDTDKAKDFSGERFAEIIIREIF